MDLNLPGAYVVYDKDRDEIVAGLLDYYRKRGVHSVGRYGQWEYGSMESAMEQGIGASRGNSRKKMNFSPQRQRGTE